MMTYEKEVVKELAQEFQEIADGIKSLKAQLAESQARELAAIADLKHNDNCDICKHNSAPPECNCECLDCQLECMCKTCRDESNWEWRGKERE